MVSMDGDNMVVVVEDKMVVMDGDNMMEEVGDKMVAMLRTRWWPCWGQDGGHG